MGVGVNARTAFSLLFPPILDEFGWERGVPAGAFSFGFLVSAVLSPSLGRLMDRRGPRVVIEMGVGLMAAGLMLATLVRQPWHLYATLGVLVGGGGVCLGYTGQALFLPNWFVRRRGLAMSLAFSGVGVGSIILLPWLGTLIGRAGWRAACWAMGILVLALLAPLNLLLKRRPEDLGLEPDGDRSSRDATAGSGTANVVDAAWVAVDWTLARAMRTDRFWWIMVGYFCGLFDWYAVQIHQTKYLVEVGFSPGEAAWALGFVSLAWGDRRAARRHRRLHAGLLDRHRLQRALGPGHLARRPARGAGRRRPGPSAIVAGALYHLFYHPPSCPRPVGTSRISSPWWGPPFMLEGRCEDDFVPAFAIKGAPEHEHRLPRRRRDDHCVCGGYPVAPGETAQSPGTPEIGQTTEADPGR